MGGYTNWAPDEPNDWGGNEDCVEASYNQGWQWNDLDCNAGNYFVCGISNYVSYGNPIVPGTYDPNLNRTTTFIFDHSNVQFPTSGELVGWTFWAQKIGPVHLQIWRRVRVGSHNDFTMRLVSSTLYTALDQGSHYVALQPQDRINLTP